MSTTAVGSTGSSTATTTTTGAAKSLTPSDFINLLVTQLQNQDPTDPVKNSDLLAQVSQISQLQTSNSLNTTLQGLTLQNQIGSAANLIGKTVKGTDANKTAVNGIVTSVQVSGSDVNLELDTGSTLALSSVTAITPVSSGTTAATN